MRLPRESQTGSRIAFVGKRKNLRAPFSILTFRHRNGMVTEMKRKSFVLLAAMMLLTIGCFGSSAGEGLLPTLTDIIGTAMPSFGEALQRYPDEAEEYPDGSTKELYRNVSEDDFSMFGVYLENHGAALGDYEVNGSMLSAVIQVKGNTLHVDFDYKKAETYVAYSAGTFDSWLKNAKDHLSAAKKQAEEGKTEEAAAEILQIPLYTEYGPASELLNENTAILNSLKAYYEPFKTVGNIVKFGRYEQDNITENGLEEIEWIVIDVQEGKSLLLSRYVLDAQAYDSVSVKKGTVWEDSSMRKWLNDDFLNTAFNSVEQSEIFLTEVDNSREQDYDKWHNNSVTEFNHTMDKVFLLSYAEANKYLGAGQPDLDEAGLMKTRAAMTAYAEKRGAFGKSTKGYKTADGLDAVQWWLRSPGNNSSFTACVTSSGYIWDDYTVYKYGAVRPAIWLKVQ